MARSVEWWLVTNVSLQPIGRIPEFLLHCLGLQNRADNLPRTISK